MKDIRIVERDAGSWAELQRQLADIQPVPVAMPSRPFSRVRALWLCRAEGCSWWNAPDRVTCRECATPRID